MKKLLVVLALGLAGCAYLVTDHSTKFSGVHNGNLMYEIQCKNVVHCAEDTLRACEGHPHKVVFQWENDRDLHYMVECQ